MDLEEGLDISAMFESCWHLLSNRSLRGLLCPLWLKATVAATSLLILRRHGPRTAALLALFAPIAGCARQLNHVLDLREQLLVHLATINFLGPFRMQVETDL